MSKNMKIDLSAPVLDISAQNISTLNLTQDAPTVKIVNMSCNPINNGDFLQRLPELQILHADEIFAELDLSNTKIQQLILRFNEYSHFPPVPNACLFCDLSGNNFVQNAENKLRITNKLKRICFGNTGKQTADQFSGTQVNSLQMLLRVVGSQTINKIVLPEQGKTILGNIRFQIIQDGEKFGVSIKKVNAEPVKNAHLGLTVYQILSGFEINQISQTDNIKLSTLLNDFRIDVKQYLEFLAYDFPASKALETDSDYNMKVRLLERSRAKQVKQGDNYLAFCVEYSEAVGLYLYSINQKGFVDFEIERKKLQQHLSLQKEVKAELVKTPQPPQSTTRAKVISPKPKNMETSPKYYQEEPTVLKSKTQRKKINLSELEENEDDQQAQPLDEVELEVYDRKISAVPPSYKGRQPNDDINSMNPEQLRKYSVKKREEVVSHFDPSVYNFMPGQIPGLNMQDQILQMNQLNSQNIQQGFQQQPLFPVQQLSQLQQSAYPPSVNMTNDLTQLVEIDYLHITPKRVYVDDMIDISNKRDIMSVAYYVTDKSHTQLNTEISELLKFSKHTQPDVAFYQAIEAYNQSNEVSISKQKQEMYTYLMVGHAALKINLKAIGESIYGIQIKDKYYRKHIIAELKYPWGSKLLFHSSPCYMHIDGEFQMFFEDGKLKTNITIENYTLQLYHNSQLIGQIENEVHFDLATYILKKFGYTSLEEFEHLRTDVMDGAIAPRYDGLYQALLILRQFDGTIEKEISCDDLLIFGQVGEQQQDK